MDALVLSATKVILKIKSNCSISDCSLIKARRCALLRSFALRTLCRHLEHLYSCRKASLLCGMVAQHACSTYFLDTIHYWSLHQLNKNNELVVVLQQRGSFIMMQSQLTRESKAARSAFLSSGLSSRVSSTAEAWAGQASSVLTKSSSMHGMLSCRDSFFMKYLSSLPVEAASSATSVRLHMSDGTEDVERTVG